MYNARRTLDLPPRTRRLPSVEPLCFANGATPTSFASLLRGKDSNLFLRVTKDELHLIESGNMSVETVHKAALDEETTQIVGTNLQNEVLSLVETDGNFNVVATDCRLRGSRIVLKLEQDEQIFGFHSSPVEMLRVSRSGSSTFDRLHCAVTENRANRSTRTMTLNIVFEERGMGMEVRSGFTS